MQLPLASILPILLALLSGCSHLEREPEANEIPPLTLLGQEFELHLFGKVDAEGTMGAPYTLRVEMEAGENPGTLLLHSLRATAGGGRTVLVPRERPLSLPSMRTAEVWRIERSFPVDAAISPLPGLQILEVDLDASLTTADGTAREEFQRVWRLER